MAYTRKSTIEFYGREDGSNAPPTTQTVQIDASQGVIEIGHPMYRSSTDGLWNIVATSAGTDAIHGFLMTDIDTELASGTAIQVALASDDILYRIYCETTGQTTDVAESTVVLGAQYGMTVDTTAGYKGFTTLDVANTNDVFTVVDKMSTVDGVTFATTDDPGCVIVKIIGSVITQQKA